MAISEGGDLLVEISVLYKCLHICPWLMLFSSTVFVRHLCSVFVVIFSLSVVRVMQL